VAKENDMKVLFLATTILTALTIGAAPVASAGGAQKMPGGGWFGHSGGSDQRACAHGAQLDRNVRTAIAYYTLAFNAGEPRLAVEKYVGVDENGNKTYTQHNPFAQNGPEAFIAFVEFYKGMHPDLHVEIVRTIAQCDLVMTHAHITTSAEDLGNVAMDIFRFDNTGRIVEHWDSVQPVEANPANGNGQF
jgi:predicted SnoaL-like aldol condensation-catalyzing enzyme